MDLYTYLKALKMGRSGSLFEDLVAIKRKTGSVIKTEFAAIASFITKRVQTAIAVEVQLDPIQDLHGYDKPWSGGAGKNKLDDDGIETTANALSVARNSGHGSPFLMKANTTYTVSCNNSTMASGVYLYTPYTSTIINAKYNATSLTYTPTEDTEVAVEFYWANGRPSGATHIQIELGSSATTYEPYSNICPISGRTEVVTSRCGKNLLRLPTYEEVIAVTDIVASYYSIPIKVKPSTNYYLQTEFINGYTAVGKGQYVLISNDPNGNSTWVAIAHNTAVGGKLDGAIMSTSEGHLYLRVMRSMLNKPAWDTLLENVETMLAEGSTATDYEPYLGNTYTTDLGRTVYGGHLDVVSGELTVDRAMVDWGTLNWTYYSAQARFRTTGLQGTIKNASSNSSASGVNAICSQYALTSYNGTASDDGAFGVSTDGALYIKDTAYTDATDFKTAMNGVQLCYELATPQTYQLTPQEVSLLLGQNNVWSDGDVSVTYVG